MEPSLSLQLKKCILKVGYLCGVSVALYGSESWTLQLKQDVQQLDAYEICIWHHIQCKVNIMYGTNRRGAIEVVGSGTKRELIAQTH